MSNRDPEATYDDPVQAITFAIQEWVRQNLRTAVPGIIRAYDARTMRARVQPALNAIVAMPGEPDEPMERAPIYDVPVVWPGCAAGVIHASLVDGDTVWLMFSERGMAQFKQTLTLADPPPMVMFATCDAVALPWRAAPVQPVEGAVAGDLSGITPTSAGSRVAMPGLTLQSADGSAYVSIRGDSVVIGGASVTHNGVNIGSDHTHAAGSNLRAGSTTVTGRTGSP